MPGSNNFLQFNPPATNQENDSTYQTDGQRVNGVASGAIVPSVSINKFRYQSSTFYTALALALATKGYMVLDGSPGQAAYAGSYSAAVTSLAAIFANVLTAADLPGILTNTPLTGNPTCPTQPSTDNSTRLADTAFVQRAVGTGNSNLVATPSSSYIYIGPLLIQFGALTVPGGSPTSFSFPKTFSARPALVMTANSSSCDYTSVSTTGATIEAARGGTEVMWVAIGKA